MEKKRKKKQTQIFLVMFVIKRNGRKEDIHFDKITSRISKLCFGLASAVQPVLIAQKVIQGIYSGVTTSELDELAAEECAAMASTHPDFGILAGRIKMSDLHKSTFKSFSETATLLYTYHCPQTGQPAPLLEKPTHDFIQAHAERLNGAIIYSRDFAYEYFAVKTLCRSYLLKLDEKVLERPQHMWMRVACFLHCGDIDSALETYELLSQGYYIHASPTLFKAGMPNPQLSSCFLLGVPQDSIEGIWDAQKQCAIISKNAGGIGCEVYRIRAKGSYIRGSAGKSDGLIPFLRGFHTTARAVNQGSKRKGAISVTNVPFHADIMDFLQLRKNNGHEEARTHDLFIALWIHDLFMRRVEEDGEWALFCPNTVPDLFDCWGEKFEALYVKYEADPKLVRKRMKARVVWQAILDSQMETGLPYMMYADSCNRKSNQQAEGNIRTSNLCCEIIQFSSPEQIAVCNLASIALPRYIVNNVFDFAMLMKCAKTVVYNLNLVIDKTCYPLLEARFSNLRHRPMGIGVQGLHDAFVILRLPYESAGAKQLNIDIFEALYFACCEASCELAERDGKYESFDDSPMAKGKFQFDLWNVTPSGKFGDWNALRMRVMAKGMRNSLLLAPMPTASTSGLLGNTESFEPITSMLYNRRTLAGDFSIVNKHLVKDLIERGLWSTELRNQLVAYEGSVQKIQEIPEDLKELYKTAFEIKMKNVMQMCADRGPFICQSQSMNYHLPVVTSSILTSAHFHAWRLGLKTGMYYLRTLGVDGTIKVTVDQEMLKRTETKQEKRARDDDDDKTPIATKRIRASLPNKEKQETEELEGEACTMKDGCVSCGA